MPKHQQNERTVEFLLEQARGIARMAAERAQVIILSLRWKVTGRPW